LSRPASTDIQANILQRLRSKVSGVASSHILEFPNPTGRDGQVQVKGPYGAVFLHYGSTAWSPPRERLTMTQAGDMSWVVTIVTRSYNDAHGALTILDEVYEALTGYSPYDDDDTKSLYPVRDGFLQRDEAFWWYFVEFKVRRVREKE